MAITETVQSSRFSVPMPASEAKRLISRALNKNDQSLRWWWAK
jgi:hypothetical protein